MKDLCYRSREIGLPDPTGGRGGVSSWRSSSSSYNGLLKECIANSLGELTIETNKESESALSNRK